LVYIDMLVYSCKEQKKKYDEYTYTDTYTDHYQ